LKKKGIPSLDTRSQIHTPSVASPSSSIARASNQQQHQQSAECANAIAGFLAQGLERASKGAISFTGWDSEPAICGDTNSKICLKNRQKAATLIPKFGKTSLSVSLPPPPYPYNSRQISIKKIILGGGGGGRVWPQF
jgi:hypothetical protein